MAKECYINALKETLQVDTTSPWEPGTKRSEPMGDLEDISLCLVDRTVQVGKGLPLDFKLQLTDFLQLNTNIFAWFPTNMPGINRLVITDKLGILSG